MSSSTVGNLSTMTGLTEAELARRADKLVDSSGGIKSLSALDAVLLRAASGTNQQVVASFQTLSMTTAQDAHVIEDPSKAFQRDFAAQAGFSTAALERATPQPGAVLDRGSKSGLAKIGKSGLDDDATSLAFPNVDPASPSSSDVNSRDLQLEALKNQMSRITEMTTLISGVMNSDNGVQKDIINNVKA